MNDMEEKRDNKEIRVRLHHIDRGNCTEVGGADREGEAQTLSGT